MPPLNDWLRGRHALTGVAPEWDLDALPAEPTILFREWILRADADGVPEPHTATLATVDTAGVPDARTLILKGIDAGGWAFASTRSSRKGEQLAASCGRGAELLVAAAGARGSGARPRGRGDGRGERGRSRGAIGRGAGGCRPRRLGSLARGPGADRVLAGIPRPPPHAGRVRARRRRLDALDHPGLISPRAWAVSVTGSSVNG